MAVLFADLVAYSKHVSNDEAAVLEYMDRCFELFDHHCSQPNGELIKTTGDGILAVFPTATSAVEYGVMLQRELQRVRPDGSDYSFRMGIHVGEVQRHDGDVYGHTVNIAARLEGLAKVGGVCVSHDVFSTIGNNSDFDFEARGAHHLKNIPGSILVYDVVQGNSTTRKRPWASRFAIRTIGGLRAASNNNKIDLPKTKIARAELGYLALCPDQSESVSRLAALLRSDVKQELGRRSVIRATRGLQARFGEALVLDEEQLYLDAETTEIDIARIEADLRLGRIDPILLRDNRWPDRLLDGLETVDPQFASWLAVIRTEWRDRIATILETNLNRFETPDDPAVRDVATALLAIEKAHERAARILILHLRASGNPGAAVRVFEKLKDVLQLRYGIAPKPETKAALDEHTPAVTGMEPIGTDPLRLQIHTFQAQTPEGSEQLSAFRNELIAGLACFRGWSIVEGQQKAEPSAAVSDYTLTAWQSDSPEQQEVVLSLAKTATGRVVWSDTYSIGAGQFDRARRQAVGRISATLEVYISTDRTSVSENSSRHTVIDTWLQGERLITRWTPESHDAAADLFAELVKSAPQFPLAYSSLASILNVGHIVRPGRPRDAESARRSHALADKAVELDPLDARNQLAVAWSAALDKAFDKASMHMDLAARLNPHSPRTLMSCAMGFSFLGEHGRAAELLAHSLDCAPMLLDYQWCYAASVYFLAGNDRAALDAAGRSGNKIIDNPGWTAAALARLGRVGEAAAAFSDLANEVAKNWAGPSQPDTRDIRDWFISAYPFRHQAERTALSEALSDAARGLNTQF